MEVGVHQTRHQEAGLRLGITAARCPQVHDPSTLELDHGVMAQPLWGPHPGGANDHTRTGVNPASRMARSTFSATAGKPSPS